MNYSSSINKMRPIVHCITNIVSAELCANGILAVGALATMAHHEQEVAEIQAGCDALVLNLGATENYEAMLCAIKKATELGHPIVVDPVGCGGSVFRRDFFNKLTEAGHINLIRGNYAEIIALANMEATTTGVDSAICVGEGEIEEYAKKLANKYSCIVVASGKIDVITDGRKLIQLDCGHEMMSMVTGIGCMSSAILGAYLAVDNSLEAAVACCKRIGKAGEAAFNITGQAGTMTFRNNLIDELYKKKRLSDSLLLYAVTDRRWANEVSFLEQVEEAIKGGVTMVQLREKDLSEEDFLEEAKAIQKICRSYNVPLLINDNVMLAKKIDADGVHVGQSDIAAGKAREILGPEKIIGVTAKTVEQAKLAQAAGADYLGSGAVFGTSTKADAKPMDISLLKEIVKSVDIPVVAIGGIDETNVQKLNKTGIAGVAVVSGIFAKKDTFDAAKTLLQLFEL